MGINLLPLPSATTSFEMAPYDIEALTRPDGNVGHCRVRQLADLYCEELPDKQGSAWEITFKRSTMAFSHHDFMADFCRELQQFPLRCFQEPAHSCVSLNSSCQQ